MGGQLGGPTGGQMGGPRGGQMDVTSLARSVGVLVPVSLSPALWAFCETGGEDAGLALSPERVARYLLTALVRALRRQPTPRPNALLPIRVALGRLDLTLTARLTDGRILLDDVAAIAHPPRVAG